MRKPNDAILVLNAGPSSIKFSVFRERGGELPLELRGEIEGLPAAPRFLAHDPAGRIVAEKSWAGTTLDHDGANGRLRALAGGDKRYGGLYELLGIGRDYDSDRLLARFAVVQRERMVAS